jgi:hypothetical protein
MKQYTKGKDSIWCDKENRKIWFQFCKNNSIYLMDVDDAADFYIMLQKALEDYFTDYPPKAGKL